MKRTYETGVEGEARAEEYLRKQYGMICLEHRHRNRAGEIDLILEDHGTIVFAEVKTRQSGEAGNGLLSVNTTKQKRIARAATLFLLQHHWMNRAIRFDVIEIHGSEILYVPNAFQPGGMFYR